MKSFINNQKQQIFQTLKRVFINLRIAAAVVMLISMSPLANAQWTRNAATQRTYLTNSGDNVGIGTTTPAFKLDIQSTAAATMSFKSTGGNASILLDRNVSSSTASLTYRTAGVNNWQTGCVSNNNYTIRNNSLGQLTFYCDYLTNNVGIGTNVPANKFSVAGNVDFSGNVGIGTTTPGYKLDVRSATNVSNGLHDIAMVADASLSAGIATGWLADGTNLTGGIVRAINGKPLFFGTSTNYQTMTIDDYGKVGIGTTAPVGKLDISGSTGDVMFLRSSYPECDIQYVAPSGSWQVGTNASGNGANGNQFYIFDNTSQTYAFNVESGTGNVGIGTTSPAFPLEISSSQNSQLHFCVPAGGPYYTSIGFGYRQIGNNTCARIDLGFENLVANSNSYLSFRTGQSVYAGNSDITQERMRITSEGNVGIGTTTPTFKLDVAGGGRISGGLTANSSTPYLAAVYGSSSATDHDYGVYGVSNTSSGIAIYGYAPSGLAGYFAGPVDVCGTIHSKEVIVSAGWCDYVFANDYKLRPLSEVESYINEHKHLPDVTAGLVIENEGLEVGKVSAQMIRKIEELTLYMIEMNKKMDEKNSQISELQKQINCLKNSR